MVDDDAIFLTMKHQVGNIKNFREYKRNESCFPGKIPQQLPILHPGSEWQQPEQSQGFQTRALPFLGLFSTHLCSSGKICKSKNCNITVPKLTHVLEQ